MALEAQPYTQEPSAEQYAPLHLIGNSDLILVIGTSRRRIHVDSRFLMRASPVFEAMFTEPFIEGRRLAEARDRNGTPPEIEFPEDDYNAFLLALLAIYYLCDFENDAPAPDLLLKFAVFADKYDLLSALSFVSRGWLSKAVMDEPNTDLTIEVKPIWEHDLKEDTWKRVLASFLIQDPQAFFHFTRELILHFRESFLDLSHESTRNETWTMLKFKLTEARSYNLAKINEHISLQIMNLRADMAEKCTCGCADEVAPFVLSTLSSSICVIRNMADTYNPQNTGGAVLFQSVQQAWAGCRHVMRDRMSVLRTARDLRCSFDIQEYWESTQEFKSMVIWLEDCGGLCLGCFMGCVGLDCSKQSLHHKQCPKNFQEDYP